MADPTVVRLSMMRGTTSRLRSVAPARSDSTRFTASMSMASTAVVVSLNACTKDTGARVRSSGMRRRSSSDGSDSR
jgi:hypothetical protein